MGQRSKFNSRAVVVAVVMAIFALVALPAITWMSLQDVAHMQVGTYDGEDEWRVWRLPNGLELRIHHPKSTTFWKKWPMQVRGRSAHYR
jgi:hypothetical protein